MTYTGKRRMERNRSALTSTIIATGAVAVVVLSALWGAGFFKGGDGRAPVSLQDPLVNATGTPGAVTCPDGEVAVLWPGVNGVGGAWTCESWPTGTPAPSTTTITVTSTPTTTTTTKPPTSTTSTPPPTTSTTTPAPTTSTTAPNSDKVLQAYITGYSYFDNTPPGSADISNPVLHQSAGGTGTYDDPITVAVGHSMATGKDVLDWPAGTRFYIPNLHRYFIVEDSCGDGNKPQNGPCHTGYPSPATTWLDVWVGGKGGTSNAADNCMNAITDVYTVVLNPSRGYPVTTGDIYSTTGCTAQYGNTVPTHS